jgi:hypothetical protein
VIIKPGYIYIEKKALVDNLTKLMTVVVIYNHKTTTIKRKKFSPAEKIP